MKKIMTVIILLVCACLPCRTFAAGLCCQLSSGVQESLSGVASPGAQNISLQFNYSFTVMDKLRQGSATRPLGEVKNEGKYTILPTRMEMTKYSVTAAYGFSPRVSVFVTVPYIRNTMDMEMLKSMGMGMAPQWMLNQMDPVKGIGDVTAMGLYRIYTDNDVMPRDTVTIGLGVKTPTGSYTKTNSGGKFIHAHMQPGTGSWDPLISLIYAKMMNPVLLQADATYQITTRNSKGYEFGDSLAANLSGKYALSRYFNVTGGFTFLHVNKATDEDGNYTNLASLMDDPANTGGDSVWFSPGIQVLPIRNSLIDLKVQFPLWEHVNGIQLVSSYRILVGVSYSF
jgi:hypothetical protein